MADVRKRIGSRIRSLRNAIGLTQEALGERSGLSYKFVGEVERGSGNPTLDSLNALATALDISLGRLMADDPNEGDYPAIDARDLLVVREARKSLDTVLKRLATSPRRRPRR